VSKASPGATLAPLRTRDVLAQQRSRLQQQHGTMRARLDRAYSDKLDGEIPEDFCQRKMADWRAEEQRIEGAITGSEEPSADRVRNAKRILELANRASFLYVTRKPHEQARAPQKGTFELRDRWCKYLSDI
jgi:hypothetical protein